MCGITGLFLRKAGAQAVPLLGQMTRALAHRGPDDEGYALLAADQTGQALVPFCGPDTVLEVAHRLKGATLPSAEGHHWHGGLGHRRLSIFDTSAQGHQPMHGQGYAMVFNGAIYNYPELRRELVEAGQTFETQSDTEVLLKAFLAWQERALPKLEGMFAFAIYDPHQRRIFACRDRLGVKPFYYVDAPEGFAFASEQKALYLLPFLNKRVSKTAVFEFLVQGHHDGRDTGMIKAVRELAPGHCLEYNLDTGTAKTWEWYKTEPNVRGEHYHERQYKRHRNRVAELLQESVALRLRADVALGACLSGGIDSAALVGLAGPMLQAQGQAAGLPVFTATFPGQGFDEGALARQTAEAAGATWHGVSPTPEELETDLIDFVATHDVPLQTPSTYAQYRVMQTAAQAGVRITLDGQGADELFGGYAVHFQAYMMQLIGRGHYGQAALQFLQANNNFANRTQTLKTFYKRLAGRFSKRGAQEAAYRGRYSELSYLRNSFWDVQKRRLGPELTGVAAGLNQMLTRDLTGPMLRGHLRLADRNSMRFGIESRVPFADSTALIEYVQRVPAVYKIKNGQNKSLLRSAVRPWVPQAVLARRNKTGFEGPNKLWMGHLSAHLKDAVLSPGMEDFLHINHLHRDWDSLMTKALTQDPHRLFRIGALGLWFKHVYHGPRP